MKEGILKPINNSQVPQFHSHRVRGRISSSAGFSYIEVLMASIIIAVLLVSAVNLFGNLGRSRQDALDQDSAAYLVREMIEEIMEQYYQDPTIAGVFGKEGDETGSGRSSFDDVDDYHNWSACPPQDRNAKPLAKYSRLTRSVTVRYVKSNSFTDTAAADEGFKEVTITIRRNNMVLMQRIYVIPNIFVGLK